MERSLDCYEQYYGRNRLFINSVKENETEDTDEVVAEIFENKMQKKSISQWHRYIPSTRKKHTRSRLRPIAIKFAGYNVRNAIFRRKMILKGRAVSITENLTKKRITEMKTAPETYGLKIVWSQDGKILFTDVNDRNKIKVFHD